MLETSPLVLLACLIFFIIVSLALEKALHSLHHHLQHQDRKGMLTALDNMKTEVENKRSRALIVHVTPQRARGPNIFLLCAAHASRLRVAAPDGLRGQDIEHMRWAALRRSCCAASRVWSMAKERLAAVAVGKEGYQQNLPIWSGVQCLHCHAATPPPSRGPAACLWQPEQLAVSFS